MVKAYQAQVRGEFGGTTGGWRPAITGTLNQSEFSDEIASVAYTINEVVALITDAMREGADEDEVRYVEGTVTGVKADGFTAIPGQTPRFVEA
jgi:hypothetical protein